MSAAEDFNADEFMRGQRDCAEGIPHQAGRSESYDRGYASQYEWNELQGEISERQNRSIR